MEVVCLFQPVIPGPRFKVPELNGPRIAAISATLCVHITAFLFLMVPIAMPEKVVQPEHRHPDYLARSAQTRAGRAAAQTAVAETRSNAAESAAADCRRHALPLPPMPRRRVLRIPWSAISMCRSARSGLRNRFVQDGGGDVDASTRARYPIEYPVAALRAGLAGTVTVLARYDANGTVMETRVYKSSRNVDFDRAALRGVKKWKINPSEINGQAIGGEALVDVVFRL